VGADRNCNYTVSVRQLADKIADLDHKAGKTDKRLIEKADSYN
jgi:hypothetical protein